MAVNPSRRTQEERSSSTRKKLAKAAFELIRDEGYASFRVASVARAAGVSQGGQLHHFPTKDAVTMAALEFAIDEAERVTIRNLERYRPGLDPVDAITQDSRAYYFSASFDVAMDVTKSASGNKELRRTIAQLHRNFRRFAEDRWQRILVAQRWSPDHARDLVAMTTSLVRGFAIRAMIHRDTAEVDRLMTRWRDMVYQTFPVPPQPSCSEGDVT